MKLSEITFQSQNKPRIGKRRQCAALRADSASGQVDTPVELRHNPCDQGPILEGEDRGTDPTEVDEVPSNGPGSVTRRRLALAD